MSAVPGRSGARRQEVSGERPNQIVSCVVQSSGAAAAAATGQHIREPRAWYVWSTRTCGLAHAAREQSCAANAAVRTAGRRSRWGGTNLHEARASQG